MLRLILSNSTTYKHLALNRGSDIIDSSEHKRRDAMAYVNQEKKAKIAAALKLVVPKGWKYSLAVRNHSTICFTLYSAPVDLIKEAQQKNNEIAEYRGEVSRKVECYFDVNPYHYQNQFTESTKIIGKILDALNTDNYDTSDIQADYFNCGHYVDLGIGRWNKAFVCTSK
jgi:hypothetical protein